MKAELRVRLEAYGSMRPHGEARGWSLQVGILEVDLGFRVWGLGFKV